MVDVIRSVLAFFSLQLFHYPLNLGQLAGILLEVTGTVYPFVGLKIRWERLVLLLRRSISFFRLLHYFGWLLRGSGSRRRERCLSGLLRQRWLRRLLRDVRGRGLGRRLNRRLLELRCRDLRLGSFHLWRRIKNGLRRLLCLFELLFL